MLYIFKPGTFLKNARFKGVYRKERHDIFFEMVDYLGTLGKETRMVSADTPEEVVLKVYGNKIRNNHGEVLTNIYTEMLQTEARRQAGAGSMPFMSLESGTETINPKEAGT